MALPNGGDLGVTVHWLSPDEMVERFAAFPDALACTGEVAARCGLALPEGEPIWPTLDLPEGQTPGRALAELARSSLTERYGPDPPPAVRERLEKELTAIERYGYAPLFLIVADVLRFARQRDIPISTRGSMANSLVAYCAGITTGLMRTIQLSPEHQRTHHAGGRVMFVSTVLIALLGFSNLDIIPLLILLVLLMLAPVFYGFRIWIEMLGKDVIKVP